MNELNHASREASQRLMDAGIVLETEAVWFSICGSNKWHLARNEDYQRILEMPTPEVFCSIPAPSMAEVWRELTKKLTRNGLNYRPVVSTWEDKTVCRYERDGFMLQQSYSSMHLNPTDALISLLIWQKGEKG